MVTAAKQRVAPKNINGWFRNCENLITAPKIPASVEKMKNTFENARSRFIQSTNCLWTD